MKYGWAIWNMAGCSQEHACRLAAELGLDFVSFNTSPLHWGRRHPGEPAAAPGLLAELGLGWTVHGALPAADGGDARGPLEEVLAFSAEAGAPLAVSFDPVCTGEKPDKRYDPDATARGLETAFELLGDLAAPIALENSPYNCGPELFVPMARRFDRLQMLLDTGHLNMHLAGDASRLAAYLDALPLPIADLHLHDNDGRADRHLALGAGTLPATDLFAELRSRGYDRLATVEVCPGLESLRPDREEHLGFLRDTLARARAGLG